MFQYPEYQLFGETVYSDKLGLIHHQGHGGVFGDVLHAVADQEDGVLLLLIRGQGK